jgi:hypothetical protein
VRLSDLKGEFFVSGDSQQLPGRDRQVEEYCKKYGKFCPKFLGPAQNLGHAAFELIANENAVHILPGYASHHSPPGVVILPLVDRGGDLEDSGDLADRQSRWCSEGIAGRPVCEGNSRS